MTYEINLDEIDVDGAIRETAHDANEALASEGAADGDTRLSFLKKAGVAGGAAMASSAVLGSVASPALAAAGHGRPPASFGKGDIGILNYALTLEYLERAFYNEATANGKVTDPETAQFLQITTRDERAHVTALKNALGSKAVKEPKFDFKGTTADQTMFQQTAFALENTGVHAYSGQATNIKSATVAKAAVSIVTIEARHASVIGRIVKGAAGISPDGAFDIAFTAQKVLSIVKGTGFIVG